MEHGGAPAELCQVCYEPFREMRKDARISSLRYDNNLACGNGHYTCFKCVANIAAPAMGDRSGGFSGFVFKCPLCRDHVGLDLFNILRVLRDSSARAVAEFPCVAVLNAWLENSSADAVCGEQRRPSEPRAPPRRSERLAAARRR